MNRSDVARVEGTCVYVYNVNIVNLVPHAILIISFLFLSLWLTIIHSVYSFELKTETNGVY